MSQFTAEVGPVSLKFYYNAKVYDPHYSSLELPMVANTFIFGRIKLLDIATGCGYTGLILKRVHPALDVTLADIDDEAVRVARLNAKRQGAEVKVIKADLIPENGEQYHVITANLPTFDAEQLGTEELHGPEIAYDGGKNGLALYTRLLRDAKDRCVVLCCEVQEARQEAFLRLAALHGWKVIEKSVTAFALMSAEKDMEGILREIQAQKLATR